LNAPAFFGCSVVILPLSLMYQLLQPLAHTLSASAA